ncbi:hypothetical protein HPO_13962 [Hyphomonas polymorpha PS728]|uniref:Sel1 repeat-containing protein n=1 Tax=Hyphomonas polymorpha PS728 TaxID=1280954 RepID=A0A062VBI8_9PROT|nr:SEL1-like repeat protein [Hyphomonas polymorpha]KCZ97604.1 hypothetical protein HPO_13962 [Hyphomonas polymorpha PS728]
MSKLKTLWRSLRGILSALAFASLPVIAGAQTLAELTLAELKVQAEAGNAAAQIEMGQRYYYGGDGAPNDNAEAKFWFNKAIAQGSDLAAYILSNHYKDENNYPEALRLMKLYGELAGDELYWEDREFLARDLAALESLMKTAPPVNRELTVGPEPHPPGLLPGEFLQQTTAGCKIVSWLPGSVAASVKQQAEQRKVEWDGRCHHGRAHGKGKLFGAYDAEFAYGYWRSVPVTQTQLDGNQYGTYTVPSLGTATTINTGPEASFAPRWPRPADVDFTTATSIQMHDRLNWNQFHVSTMRSRCYPQFKDTMTAAQKKALSGKRCRGNAGDVQVYYVKVSTNNHPHLSSTDLSGFRYGDHFCPDPKTSKGCESVWEREMVPFLPRMTMLAESAVALEARRPQEDKAIAAWGDYERKLEAWKQAGIDADKAAAEQAKAQKAAAAEQSRLEAAAREEAEQKELADSLKTLNPGQMLAKADELEQAGRIEDARTVRREILSRFPDHPLAIVAAEKLTAAPKPPAGPEAEFAALRKRAEKGEVSAQMELASAYYSGKGAPQDRAEAARWYRAAADKGNADAQNYLGVMLSTGNGIRQDEAEAALYYRLAADQGHAAAQYNLGNAYYNGMGVTQNQAEAAHWYQAAARQGYALAQTSLGFLYWQGEGVAQNSAEAVRWFEAAAEQGNANAQNYLGVMLYDGTDIPRDYVRAARYFRLAADQGLAAAQNNLGNAYRHGNGVNKDTAAATAWFRAASKQGHELATKDLAALEKQLADEAYQQRLAQQQAEAQRAEAQRAQEQRQRQQEADSKAWGMLAAGGLAAALGGNTDDVLGAMTGQPVVRQQSSSGSSSPRRDCSGQNRTASCLMEQCKDQIEAFRRTHPGRNLECRPSTAKDGGACVAFIDHENTGNYSITCTNGFGAAR